MADVQLTRMQAQSGRLPAICMQCGEPATETMERKYSTDKTDMMPPPPEPVGCLVLFPIMVLAKIFSAASARTMTVRTPLCHKHARSWFAWNNLDAKAIDDEGILIGGASQAFVDAWEKQRSAEAAATAKTASVVAPVREVVKVRCRQCQALNLESAKFCDQCGAAM